VGEGGTVGGVSGSGRARGRTFKQVSTMYYALCTTILPLIHIIHITHITHLTHITHITHIHT
jgi:hypothetical protein